MCGVNVVTWKWKAPPGYRSRFEAEHVNVLRRMVRRHYQREHEFICVTDDPTGLDPEIRVVPMWNDFADVKNPHGGHQPSCYRRLKAFSTQARDWFGPRFVSLDLDTVIVRDITPLLDRTEDFVCWGETNRRSWYNGSMWMMTAGARKQVWEQFDPETSPLTAKMSGRYGSDQGWMSYILGPGEATWTRADGVYSYRVHIDGPRKGQLPLNAKLVHFHGVHDPWGPRAQKLAWVKEHWC